MAPNLDQRLLDLLRSNSRESIANLAKKLGVSRATVKQHMDTLERRKIIESYTIRYHPQHLQQVTAYLMIEIVPKLAGNIVRRMEKMSEVESLFSISGNYDLLAVVNCANTRELDQTIDLIASLDGVEKTLTSIVLGAKFQR